MPDEPEPTLNAGAQTPEGASPPEPEPILDADAGSDPAAGDTGVTEPGEPRGPVPYDRFATVARERKAMEEAAKAAGLQWDSESKQFIKPDEKEPDDAGLEWEDAPETDEDTTGAISDPAFWQMRPEAMQADATWQQIAQQYGLDPTEMVPNEWAFLRRQASRDYSDLQAEQQQQTYAEQQARTEVVKYLAGLDKDPLVSVSPKVRSTIAERVKELKEQNWTAAKIQGVLPLIRNEAIVAGLDDIVQARVQDALRGADSRKVTLGGQSPEPQGNTGKPVVSLTAAELETAKVFGIAPERMERELARIRGDQS